MTMNYKLTPVLMPLIRGVTATLMIAMTLTAPLHAAPSEPEALATGTWYGEFSGGSNQPLQRFLTTRLADGTFTLRARVYDKGRFQELNNQGLWGISNGLYFTVTTEVDGKRADFRTADVTNPYLIRKLAGNDFEYQHIPSGRIFHVKRVDPATAHLPD
jgi:hypothetical protein